MPDSMPESCRHWGRHRLGGREQDPGRRRGSGAATGSSRFGL